MSTDEKQQMPLLISEISSDAATSSPAATTSEAVDSKLLAPPIFSGVRPSPSLPTATDGGMTGRPRAASTPSMSETTAAGASGLKSGLSTGSRPKACSVHIVEPIPTFETRRTPSLVRADYKVVKTEEKHGILQRAIPVMPIGLAVVACVLNIVLPGIGTLLAGFSVLCCGATTRLENRFHAFLLNIAAGLLQVGTFLLIVGWIWSITWGMTFVQMALSANEFNPRPTVPYYVRRHSSVE